MVGFGHLHVTGTEVGLPLLTDRVTDTPGSVTGPLREFPETDPMTDCPEIETDLLESDPETDLHMTKIYPGTRQFRVIMEGRMIVTDRRRPVTGSGTDRGRCHRKHGRQSYVTDPCLHVTDTGRCHVPGPGLLHVVVIGPGHREDSQDRVNLLLTREVIGQTPEIATDSPPIMTDIVHPLVTITPGQSHLCHVTGTVTLHVTRVTTEI